MTHLGDLWKRISVTSMGRKCEICTVDAHLYHFTIALLSALQLSNVFCHFRAKVCTVKKDVLMEGLYMERVKPS